MLRELRIENLLLIDRAELRFDAGLNVITGETGAGKTVLAHSLDLLLGGKPRSGIVRPGAGEAWVEGSFDLPAELRTEPELSDLLDRVPPDDAEVVLARRVSAAGRSAAFVAGRAASAADLRALGGRLLAFFGQHEHRKLTLASAQAEILDAFTGADHLALRDRYAEAHAEVVTAERELDELREREGARERDLDLLRFELAEIESAAPDLAEHESLVAERDRLRGVEGLREDAGTALAALTGTGDEAAGTLGALAEGESGLERGASADRTLASLAERLAATRIELADLAGELRSYLDVLEADPARLEEVEARLEAIDRLLRKHGGDIASVLAHAESCRSEIARLEGAAELAASLGARLDEAAARRVELGSALTKSRRKAAPRLEREVGRALSELAMEGATVEVTLPEHPAGYGPAGRERVELVVAVNAGLPPAPLGEAASGGELSRLMLALTGLGPDAERATVVFDEIDAGVGGKVARRVGERLRDLGAARQVICITHLPQVASMAAVHFRVEKADRDGTAEATVQCVEGETLVAEIVRMLGAEEADAAADRHARELLAA